MSWGQSMCAGGAVRALVLGVAVGLSIDFSLGMVGCASAPAPASASESFAGSADPFARWVAALEVGQTRVEDVRARFGVPRERDPSPRGGWVWRYDHSEIHWSENDPLRPTVSAQGERRPPQASPGTRFVRALGAPFRWLGGVLMYPPLPRRPPPSRLRPATIHVLEIDFGLDGTIESIRYRPREGLAPVSIPG